MNWVFRVAFVPYLCAGDPNIGVTKKAIQRLDEIQADVIEVGVPYSVSALAGALLLLSRVLEMDCLVFCSGRTRWLMAQSFSPRRRELYKAGQP